MRISSFMARPVGAAARLVATSLLASLLLALAGGPMATVLAADSLTLTTPYPAVTVAPGSSVTFDLSVKTSNPDRVDLKVSGAPTGWTATLHGGGFIIDAVQTDGKAAATATLDVAVPASASGSTHLTVTASGGGSTTTLGLDLTVQASTGDVTMTPDFPSLKGSSSTDFTFNMTLVNSTSQDLTFTVNATGPDGWKTSAQFSTANAASTVVKAGDSTSFTVTSTPSDNAAAGQYPIHVVATAGSKQVTQDLQVQVTGVYTMTMSTPDQVLSTSGNAASVTEQQLTITNSGSSPITNVTMSDTVPTDWNVTFDQPTIATIAPSQTVTVTARVTPSSNAIAGDYQLTFNANGDNGATANEQIRFTVQTSIQWAIVGIALIVLVFVGLWWVFRRYGRR
ncbi:MAG TPA: NEW3 domain-containing protein [Candidatus Limnocylindrales bacterium]|nr:NEW3 domain-containing protein [Candidatus Limnocylindrales bacterium]